MSTPMLAPCADLPVVDLGRGDIVRYKTTVYLVSEVLPVAESLGRGVVANAADGAGGWVEQRTILLYANLRASAELITGGAW